MDKGLEKEKYNTLILKHLCRKGRWSVQDMQKFTQMVSEALKLSLSKWINITHLMFVMKMALPIEFWVRTKPYALCFFFLILCLLQHCKRDIQCLFCWYQVNFSVQCRKGKDLVVREMCGSTLPGGGGGVLLCGILAGGLVRVRVRVNWLGYLVSDQKMSFFHTRFRT